jgi:hypothetical protein
MPDSKLRRSKSILLLVGSFVFAFLLGEAVHELDHYLAHEAYGNAGIGIHLDPFGGSCIVGVTSLPLEVMGVTCAAGPLSNLALAIACFLLLWHRRKPVLLPLLLWGPVAMAQEGGNLSLGLLARGRRGVDRRMGIADGRRPGGGRGPLADKRHDHEPAPSPGSFRGK